MQPNVQPRLQPEANKSWKKWWQLTRPHTLTAAFVPVLLGTALSLELATFNIPMFIAMLVACILIQAATNMFNEYYDYKNGLDTEESVGIGGAIVRDGIQPKTIMQIALSLYAISVLIGIYICMNSSWYLALIGIVGMLVGYLYTGGPKPIAYTPFGELFAGLFMGMLIILISFFVQAQTITVESIIVSIPSFLLVAAILLSNSIRDLVGDEEFGRRTLAIIVGRDNAIKVLAGFFIASYLIVIILVLTKVLTPFALLVLLSVKVPMKSIITFKNGIADQPMTMAGAMIATAKTNTIFGLLLAIGIIIGHLI